MKSVAKTTIKAPTLEELREPPPHPGEILLEEFLKPQGITQVDAARHLRMSTTCLNELVRGNRGCPQTRRGASATGCAQARRSGWTSKANGICGTREKRANQPDRRISNL